MWQWLKSHQSVAESLFVKIKNPPCRFDGLITTLSSNQMAKAQSIGLPSMGVSDMDLFSIDEQLVRTADGFLAVCSSSVILDITSFPKKFFFPFLHRLLLSTKIKNLLVTYTSPGRYYDGPLAEDHKPLAPLPLFRAQRVGDKVDVVIVSVGFMPLGLADFLEKYKNQVETKTLFPFPPGPPGFQRNWRFINALRRDYPEAVKSPIRVDGHDVSDAFNHIRMITGDGKNRCEFGPFGPKPLSLAMCLYARLSRSVVRYTQPTVYHPQYTTGIRTVEGRPSIHTYCVRLNGVDLYQISD